MEQIKAADNASFIIFLIYFYLFLYFILYPFIEDKITTLTYNMQFKKNDMIIK